MVYVYSRHIKTEREDYIGVYENERDAIQKIAQCYRIDSRTYQLGDYYYFMKKH